MRILSISFIILFVSLTACAQQLSKDITVTIKGRIFDEEKEPISGATVQLFSSGVKVGNAASDIDGNFLFRVPYKKRGIYEMHTSYHHYITDTLIVNLDHLQQAYEIQLRVRTVEIEAIEVNFACPKMINPFNPSTTIITANQIEKMAR